VRTCDRCGADIEETEYMLHGCEWCALHPEDMPRIRGDSLRMELPQYLNACLHFMQQQLDAAIARVDLAIRRMRSGE
jgi:hypothetical protein